MCEKTSSGTSARRKRRSCAGTLLGDARPLKIGGIGSLVVAPDLRRLGVGTVFLEAVHGWLSREDYDGALLFSGIGTEFYERFGYERLPLRRLAARLRDWRAEGPPDRGSAHLRPFEPDDLPAVQSLFHTAASQQRLAVLRSRDAWEFQRLAAEERRALRPDLRHPPGFLVAEEDGRVVAYLRCSLHEDGRVLQVDDYAFEAAHGTDVTAMLRTVLESLGDAAPRRPVLIGGVAPSRLRNLVPARHATWTEAGEVMMMASLGSLRVPSGSAPDEHLVWPSDHF